MPIRNRNRGHACRSSSSPSGAAARSVRAQPPLHEYASMGSSLSPGPTARRGLREEWAPAPLTCRAYSLSPAASSANAHPKRRATDHLVVADREHHAASISVAMPLRRPTVADCRQRDNIITASSTSSTSKSRSAQACGHRPIRALALMIVVDPRDHPGRQRRFPYESRRVPSISLSLNANTASCSRLGTSAIGASQLDILLRHPRHISRAQGGA